MNVAIEGLDRSRIPGSFSVHLLKDGERIASRFLFQPSEGPDHAEAVEAPRFAHFDFLLPLGAVAAGELSVEIEPLERSDLGEAVSSEQLGNPTLSVYLMLETK